MTRLKAALLTLVAAPLALTAPEAIAQLTGVSGAGGWDIAADHSEFQANQCLSRWSGAVEALRDGGRLRADTIDVYGKTKSVPHPGAGNVACGGIDRMEANGNVYYVTPTEIVRGDHAVFTEDAKTILVTGQVVVARGKDVIAGTRLLIHTDTKEATMESDVTGAGRAGRVRAVIYPNSAQAGGGGGLQPPRPPPPRQHGV